jgi:hypothetical protein
MTETIIEDMNETINTEDQPKMKKAWLWKIWINPRQTLTEIGHMDEKCWWLPLVVLSGIQLIKSLVEIPAQKAAAAATAMSSIKGLDQMSSDQMTQIQQSMSFKSGGFFTFVLPLLAGLASIWLVWLVLSSVLHLSLTMTGSRISANSSFNLTAWSSLPIGIRLIVQMIAALFTQQVIANPGFSGFVLIQGRLTMMLYSILSLIDIYILWQMIFLIIGVKQTSHVKTGKAIGLVGTSFILSILLAALPGFISKYLASLSGNSISFF